MGLWVLFIHRAAHSTGSVLMNVALNVRSVWEHCEAAFQCIPSWKFFAGIAHTAEVKWFDSRAVFFLFTAELSLPHILGRVSRSHFDHLLRGSGCTLSSLIQSEKKACLCVLPSFRILNKPYLYRYLQGEEVFSRHLKSHECVCHAQFQKSIMLWKHSERGLGTDSFAVQMLLLVCSCAHTPFSFNPPSGSVCCWVLLNCVLDLSTWPWFHHTRSMAFLQSRQMCKVLILLLFSFVELKSSVE